MIKRTKRTIAKQTSMIAMTAGQQQTVRRNAIYHLTPEQCQEANEKIIWHGKAIYVSVAAAMDEAHSRMKDIMEEEKTKTKKEKCLRFKARWYANTAWQRIELYMARINKNTKCDEKLYCDILDELDNATEERINLLTSKTSTILVQNGIRNPFFKARVETICMLLDLAKIIYNKVCQETIEDTGLSDAGKVYMAYDPEPIRKWWEEATILVCDYSDEIRCKIADCIQETLDQLFDRVVHTSDLMENIAAKHPDVVEAYERKRERMLEQAQ